MKILMQKRGRQPPVSLGFWGLQRTFPKMKKHLCDTVATVFNMKCGVSLCKRVVEYTSNKTTIDNKTTTTSKFQFFTNNKTTNRTVPVLFFNVTHHSAAPQMRELSDAQLPKLPLTDKAKRKLERQKKTKRLEMSQSRREKCFGWSSRLVDCWVGWVVALEYYIIYFQKE